MRYLEGYRKEPLPTCLYFVSLLSTMSANMENNNDAGTLFAAACEEMEQHRIDGEHIQWTVRAALEPSGIVILKEYHAGPLSGKTFEYQTGVEVTPDEKLSFVPAELSGTVSSKHPSNEVLAGGRCPHCKQQPCFSLRLFRSELYEMERSLVREGKTHASIREALLQRGYDCFCACSPPERKPEKLPLCFGMH